MRQITWIDLSENGYQLFLKGHLNPGGKTFVVQEIIDRQQSKSCSTTLEEAGFSKNETGYSAPVTLRNSLVLSSVGSPKIMVNPESVYFENRNTSPSPTRSPDVSNELEKDRTEDLQDVGHQQQEEIPPTIPKEEKAVQDAPYQKDQSPLAEKAQELWELRKEHHFFSRGEKSGYRRKYNNLVKKVQNGEDDKALFFLDQIPTHFEWESANIPLPTKTETKTELEPVKASDLLIFESILKLSADTPDELRSIDIDRVIDAAEDQNIKVPFVQWLLNQDLQDRTRELLQEVTLAKTEKIEDFGEKIGGARKDTSTPSRSTIVRKKDTRPAWRRRYSIVEGIADIHKCLDFRGVSEKINGKFFIIDNRTGQSFKHNYNTRLFDTPEEAESLLPIIVVSQKHQVSRVSVEKDQPEKFQIIRRVTQKKYAVIKEDFEYRAEAMRYLAEHAVDIIEKKTRFDDSIHPQLKTAVRIGPHHRPAGRDVTPEEFHELFGFRGVEFGNWNSSAERQHILNQAYDAFLDLSEILQVSPKAMAFNGELAIGFGSRGHGLSGAKAHYERDYCVINLTKIKGAGSLAHEWFHAMDHFLARESGKASTEKETNKSGDIVYTDVKNRHNSYVSHGFPYRSRNKLDENLTKRFDVLMDTIESRKVQFFEDISTRGKIEQRMSKELFKKLDDFRASLEIDYTVQDYPWFRGRKNNLPATPEQLQRVDEVINRMKEGLYGEMKAAQSKKAKFPYFFKETTLELSGLYKEIRGRQGYSSQQGRMVGTIADIHHAVQTKERADISLADAEEQKAFYRTVKTEYSSHAWKMDQGATKDYWGTFHEISARAFESFIFDKLKANGHRNDFLAYEKHNDLLEYRIFGVKPYPEGAEREAINTEFEKVFELYRQTILGQEDCSNSMDKSCSAELDDMLQSDDDSQEESCAPRM
jgi:hypothetical protein